MRPGFKSRWGREVFRFVRRVSVCEKSFRFGKVFGIARSVSDLWELADWVIGMFEFWWYLRLYTHAFCHSFFEGTKNHCYFVKMQMRKSESADLFHLKIQLFCVFFKAVTASINGNVLEFSCGKKERNPISSGKTLFMRCTTDYGHPISKIPKWLGRCGRQNMLRPYLKNWEW